MSEDIKIQTLDLTDGTQQSRLPDAVGSQAKPGFQTAFIDSTQQNSGFLDLSSTSTTGSADFELSTSPNHSFLGTNNGTHAENHTLMGDKGDIELLGAGATVASGSRLPKILGLGLVVVLVGIASYFAYEQFIVGAEHANTFAQNLKKPKKVKEIIPEAEAITEASTAEVVSPIEEIAPEIESIIAAPQEEAQTGYSYLENMYASLPNRFVNDKGTMGAVWTRQEQKEWKAGLEHKFIYQRLQTIRKMRKLRKRDSHVLLRNFLNSKQKFWLKFEAAQALVEFGETLSRAEIKNIFGNTRPALVSKYFTRFSKEHDNSTAYLMRYGIPYVSDTARRNALVALANHPYSPENKLYLTAALGDPMEQIQHWVSVQSSRGKIVLARNSELQANRSAIIETPISSGYIVDKVNNIPQEATIDSNLQGNTAEAMEAVVDYSEIETLNKAWEETLQKDQDTAPEIKAVEFFDGE